MTLNMAARSSHRYQPAATDALLIDIADYVANTPIHRAEAYQAAAWCLMDAIACMLMASSYPACTQLLGPSVPGATLATGARVPATDYCLEPVQAAFNIGCLIRWLDFNDTWLAAEWGHPSDNLGSILAISDYLSRQRLAQGKPAILLNDVFTAMIKAYEIQGVLALENSFNRVGLDHVLLVKIASTAVVSDILGANQQQIINAISNAFMDGGCLRAYRHAPLTGTRKSWAAGDACRRAVQLALMALQGDMGYRTVLSTQNWGFCDVLLKGKRLQLSQPLGSAVIENILFKINYPAEFHAQTAVEAAVKLYPQVKDRIAEISRIQIETQQPALRVIHKTAKLQNPADRDHCLQYMVAVALLTGQLSADNYEDLFAQDERIDQLRAKMQLKENPQFSQDYLDPEKRSIANSIQIFFQDNSFTRKVLVEFPLGHKRRRREAMPLLRDKFEQAVSTHLSGKKAAGILRIFASSDILTQTPVNEMMALLASQ